MTEPLRLIIVEDATSDAELMVLYLTQDGFKLDWRQVQTEPDYLDALETVPDIILADWSLPQFSGLRALELMHARGMDIPFIIVSGSIGEEAAVGALRQGAYDYLLKDRPHRLATAVNHALEDKRQRENRRKAEIMLRDSEEKFRSYIENAPDGVLVANPEGKYIDVNPAACRMTGYSRSELLRMNFADLTAPEDLPKGIQHFETMIATGRATDDFRFITKSGELRWWTVDAVKLDDDHFLGYTNDITERVLAEQQLKSSLAEKEVLLREIYHRVKNNLEVILSLADIQARRLQDPQTVDSLRKLQERIRTISLVHDSTYSSPDLAQIQANAYFEKLAGNLFLAFGFPGVKMQVEAEDIFLNVDNAIPCGLIVTELVANALTHAFPVSLRQEKPDQLSEIWVKAFTGSGQIILQVSDNGIGLPTELDWRNATTMGLRLVNWLAAQIRATIDLRVDHGTHFQITLPAPD